MSETNPKLNYWYRIARAIFAGILLIAMGRYLDSLRNSSEKQGQSTKPDTVAFWSAKDQLSLKEDMMGRTDLQNLKVKPRAEFCDCLIRKLKAAYPNGFYKSPDTAQVNAMNVECLDSLTFRSAEKSDGTTIFKDLKM